MYIFNKIFAMKPNSDQLLELLGVKKGEFGRFRSIMLTDNDEYGCITVETRCGGNNREYCFPEWVYDHVWYQDDFDDDFDDTYAYIRFRIPSNAIDFLAIKADGYIVSEFWAGLFTEVEGMA